MRINSLLYLLVGAILYLALRFFSHSAFFQRIEPHQQKALRRLFFIILALVLIVFIYTMTKPI